MFQVDRFMSDCACYCVLDKSLNTVKFTLAIKLLLFESCVILIMPLLLQEIHYNTLVKPKTMTHI